MLRLSRRLALHPVASFMLMAELFIGTALAEINEPWRRCNMDQQKLNEYEAELRQAMSTLHALLSDSIKTLGIVESFLHLSRKELLKPNEPAEEPKKLEVKG